MQRCHSSVVLDTAVPRAATRDLLNTAAVQRTQALSLLGLPGMEVPAWDGSGMGDEYPAVAESHHATGKKRKRRHELRKAKELQRLASGTIKLSRATVTTSGACSARAGSLAE